MIRLAVLGATGSIGKSTLEVVRRHPERFEVVVLAAGGNVAELARLAAEFRPERAIVAVPGPGGVTPSVTGRTHWSTGRESLLEAAGHPEVDVVVNALVGFAGLEPTLCALRAGKRLALANKESLVAGGKLVLAACREGGGEIVPIDSEHSAILQCLEGTGVDRVSRLVLTASGGPFRGWNPRRLEDVGPEDALRHPTWEMGAKISIDSATLANKALEVIEAHYLYGIGYDAIDVVVHPQSIVHSFVEFVDGSVLAQVGEPTMELPILYALSYPERVEDAALRTFDPVASSPLTFEPVDHDAFPLFGLGVEAGRRGGAAPAAFNAANEEAVRAFLGRTIGFADMADVVDSVLRSESWEGDATVDELIRSDADARRGAREAIGRVPAR